MDYPVPDFTPEMAKTHTILFPNMAPVQFSFLSAAIRSEGYDVRMLGNRGPEVSSLGLRYVHNDTCYPALLIIGQFLDALNSGDYDLEHTALLITQSGGGCRASNYIKLLRKALAKAGYGYIPVLSLNASGLEKNSSLTLSPRLFHKLLAAVEYGDEVFALRNQVAPYEIHKGDADRLVKKWLDQASGWFRNNRGYTVAGMKKRFDEIAKSFAVIPVKKTPKVKVGVVGEIYVKFSPLGNNDLQKFLESQDCEVNLPGLMGYVNYCIANMSLDVKLYGGKKTTELGAEGILTFMDKIGMDMSAAMKKYGFYAPGSFRELMTKTDGIIHLGAKMGEGWLLSAEMAELIEGGYPNIICAQPFGCLPNHIMGKGVVGKLRQRYPEANITPIDYDPSATRVNQENRIRLMLAVAKENMKE